MNILKNRFIYIWVSIVLFIFSVIFLAFTKLNLWIDMTWWMQINYDYQKNVDINKVVSELESKKKTFLEGNKQVINSINAYNVTWEKTVAIVVWFYSNSDEKKLEELKINFKNQVFDVIKKQDDTAIESKYINIWKSFWDYIKRTAYITLILAIIAITIYVTYAFSWVVSWVSILSFAIITIITLFHDVIISSWLYVFTWIYLPQFQIDTFFITALLTILWYSINDTIVVFDRIRSNLKKYAGKWGKNWKDLYEIINLSVNETMTRSIYTSLTVVFVLITILIFGPDTITWFILVMIYWTIVGTYSSIFIASPILYETNKNKILTEYKKEELSLDDKIVV